MSSEEGEYWNDGPGDRHSLLIIRQEGDGRPIPIILSLDITPPPVIPPAILLPTRVHKSLTRF